MLNLLNWNKPLRVNGIIYANSEEAYEDLKDTEDEVTVELNFETEEKVEETVEEEPAVDDTEYLFKVRQYLTKPPTREFDFHTKMNNGIPVPMRTMIGKVKKETRGMMLVRLEARALPTARCMVCGRTLTNKVSMLFGVGPECADKFGIPTYATEEDADDNYDKLAKQMSKIVWEGWIIKSAIEIMQPLDELDEEDIERL